MKKTIIGVIMLIAGLIGVFLGGIILDCTPITDYYAIREGLIILGAITLLGIGIIGVFYGITKIIENKVESK